MPAASAKTAEVRFKGTSRLPDSCGTGTPAGACLLKEGFFGTGKSGVPVPHDFGHNCTLKPFTVAPLVLVKHNRPATNVEDLVLFAATLYSCTLHRLPFVAP